MKKMKLTYRNEITITLGDMPRNYFRMRRLVADENIGIYCAKLFMEQVKCPKGTAFGGKIIRDEPRLLECEIFEQTAGYAGKIAFVYPAII